MHEGARHASGTRCGKRGVVRQTDGETEGEGAEGEEEAGAGGLPTGVVGTSGEGPRGEEERGGEATAGGKGWWLCEPGQEESRGGDGGEEVMWVVPEEGIRYQKDGMHLLALGYRDLAKGRDHGLYHV